MFPSANEFPAPAGQMIVTKLGDGGQEASAKDLLQRTDLIVMQRNAKPMAKQVARPRPKDVATNNLVGGEPDGLDGTAESDQTKQREQFYGNAFAYRGGSQASIRDRVHSESIITAELKTNVIVHPPPPPIPLNPSKPPTILTIPSQVADEYTFLTTFTTHLAHRFQRPPTSISISLAHSACLIFANSFDPAYILTVTALPSQVQSTTNKRNVALLQAFIAQALNVPATRGIVRFIAVAEENLGTGGVTVLGEIESLSKGPTKEKTEEKRKAEGKGTKDRKRTTAGNGKQPESKGRRGAEAEEKSGEAVLQLPRMPEIPTEKSELDIRAERMQKMGKRKSFLQLFGK